MEHLALMARFILIEKADGYTDVKDSAIQKLIDESQVDDGVGSSIFESDTAAKGVIKTLNLYYSIFENDPMIKDGGEIQELRIEYFILSFYLLLRHLRKLYIIEDNERKWLHEFFTKFHSRWRHGKSDDNDILQFSGNRQQGAHDLRERDIVLRALFFDWLKKHDHVLVSKDESRAFNEGERIEIYRRDKGVCQLCINEGLLEDEAQVPWDKYQADHILAWSKGGKTDLNNAQLLCSRHNQSKGAT